MYLGLAKRRQRRKRKKQPKRSPARQWQQAQFQKRLEVGGSKVALLYLTFIHSWKLECLDSFCSSTALFGCCICEPARLARKAFQFSLLLAVLSRYFAFAWVIPFPHVLATVGHKVSNYWKCGILLAAEEVVRAGV